MTAGDSDAAQLFELCPDLLAVTHFDGHLLTINPAWTRVLGWSREELLSRPYHDFLHPDDAERTVAAAEQLMAGGSVSGFLNRYRHRDGSYRWLSWDARGEVATQRMYAAVRDVTEERRTQTLRSELEHITGVGTWELDLDTQRVYWSPVTHAIHGTDPASPPSTLDRALSFYPGDQRRLLEARTAEVLETGQPAEMEVPFVTIDGRGRWVRLTLSVDATDGHVVRAFGTMEDVTTQVEERQQLRRFRDLLELTEEGIAELAADGTLTYANARLARMMDLERPEALEGRAAHVLLHPEHAQEAAAWFNQRVAAGDDVTRGQVRLATSGPERWAQVALRVQRGDDGEVAGGTAVFTDVTRRVLRERELDQARVLLEEAQTLARIGHWRWNCASGEVVASPVVHDIVHDGPGALTVTGYLAAVHPEDRTRVPGHVRELPPEGPLEIVHRLLTPSGQERTVHLRATLHRGDDGRIVTLQGTLQDVTALHRTEQALQRALRATNDGWWDEDLRAGQASYSDRWWEIHGCPPQPGRHAAGTWRRFVPEEELPGLDAAFAEVVAEQRPTFRFHGHVLHVSGRKVPVVVRGSVEYDPQGRPVRISGATSDVTEEVRAERAKEVFVSTVSHELRTPLTAIGGALELLATGRGGPLPQGAQELVAIGSRNTDRLHALIADLLDVEQLRTGAATMDLQAGPLGPIVEAAIADLSPAAAAQRVHLHLELPADDPVVQRDAGRIGQVVRNLVSNAVRYAPIDTTVEAQVQPLGQDVEVVIIDHGPGVPDSFRQRAFDRFAQADPDDPRSRGGTGLGLAISREIIDRHGGRIGYDSRPGDTRFWFRLPRT